MNQSSPRCIQGRCIRGTRSFLQWFLKLSHLLSSLGNLMAQSFTCSQSTREPPIFHLRQSNVDICKKFNIYWTIKIRTSKYFIILVNIYIPIAKKFFVFFFNKLWAYEAKKILNLRKVSLVIVLYVQQIDMLIHFSIGEPNRKERKFFLFLDAVHVDGDVIEIFKLFNLI